MRLARLAPRLAGALALAGGAASSVPAPLFAGLERLSRLADISYCVGNSGVRRPFRCLSRCGDFPELALAATWNTGLLLSDSCGYIAVDGGGAAPGIVVVFRGTYSIANAIVDLSTVPQRYMPYPGPGGGRRPGPGCANCTVHMGFFASWRNARRVVLPELEALRARHPASPIHLVGHSLGGAVACLAALELRVSLGWAGVSVTTFGEPRLGNGGLARFVDAVFGLDDGPADPESWSYRRVTHVDDPVPLLPWDEWGYSSHAGEIYISKPDLSPTEADLRPCAGGSDPACSTGGAGRGLGQAAAPRAPHHVPGPGLQARPGAVSFPTRLRLWQLLFAHRDYFWRLGLCVPGGDPAGWGAGGAAASPGPDEL